MDLLTQIVTKAQRGCGLALEFATSLCFVIQLAALSSAPGAKSHGFVFPEAVAVALNRVVAESLTDGIVGRRGGYPPRNREEFHPAAVVIVALV